MNYFLIIAFASFGLAIIGGYALSNIEAQEEIPLNDKYFKWLGIEIVFNGELKDEALKFWQDAKAEEANWVNEIREHRIALRVFEFEGVTYIQGEFIFEEDADAFAFKDKIVNYFKNNPNVLNKVFGGRIIITDNNHHSTHVTPDIIVFEKVYGDISALNFIQ